MKNKFEYNMNVSYTGDDPSYHITNSDGCVWDDGVGVAPDGVFCGECNRVRCKTCEVREKHRREESK